jgi:molybdopterin molybdotransferase
VKIAVICTGDELMDPSGELTAGKTYNSIGCGLAARCWELGCEPLDLGICSDEVDEMTACLDRGCREADLVVVTGGISAGDSDLVPEALAQMGADLFYCAG